MRMCLMLKTYAAIDFAPANRCIRRFGVDECTAPCRFIKKLSRDFSGARFCANGETNS